MSVVGLGTMLMLSRKTDYALIALVHLGCKEDSVISARDIAGRYRVPLPVLMGVLKVLTREGMVRSVRGARGGYRLARRADSITLRALIQAVEGPVRLVPCAGDRSPEEEIRRRPCDVRPNCPIRDTVHQVHHRLSDFLEEITLSQIIEQARERGRVPSGEELSA